jgi:hypothetical protein
MLKVEIRGLDRAIRDLEKFKKSAVPYAVREYANSAAFLARTTWIKRAEANMVLRTQYTARSLQVEKAGLQLGRQQARVGSTADYMRTQEEGAVESAQGKHGVPLPARAPGNRKRSKSRVAAKNRLAAIQLRARAGSVSGSRQRRNAVAIGLAAKAGGGVVFLDLRKSKGLYRVSGTKRGIRIRKVWDLSKKRVRIPRNPMLQQTLDTIDSKLPALAMKALTFQLKRHKVFGY